MDNAMPLPKSLIVFFFVSVSIIVVQMLDKALNMLGPDAEILQEILGERKYSYTACLFGVVLYLRDHERNNLINFGLKTNDLQIPPWIEWQHSGKET